MEEAEVLGMDSDRFAAYRANELLSLRVRQVRGLEVGDVIDGAQSKSDRSSAGDA
jgi:hypothetical protein